MSSGPNPNGIPIDDRGKIITWDLIPGHEYEVIVRAIGPDGTMQPMEEAARNTIVIEGKQEVPNAIVTFTAVGFLEAVTLTWVNALDYDIDHVEIWRSATNDIDTAAKIAEVKGITYIDAIGEADVTRYYWIRAVNTSGIASYYYPDTTTGFSATTLGVAATDIDDFAITATKMFTKAIILTTDVWTNNYDAPTNTKIGWNAHSIVYNGASYPITAGNTALKYVYWTIGSTTYTGSATHPTLGVTAFMIAINTSGIHTLVWNDSANMVIGTAFIADLAVTNAKIYDCNVAKLTAGTITSKAIILATAGSVDCSISAGKTQWDNTQTGFILGIDNTTPKFYIGSTTKYLNWDGSALTVRGTLNADDLIAGTVTGRTVQTAASGVKRAVISGVNNNIQLLDASDNNIVLIDDGVYDGKPGILINGDGVIQILNSATKASLFTDTSFNILSDVAAQVGQLKRTVSSSTEILRLWQTASTTGEYLICMNAASAIPFKVDYNGDITALGNCKANQIWINGSNVINSSRAIANLTGLTLASGNIVLTQVGATVDGVDVSAHTHSGVNQGGTIPDATTDAHGLMTDTQFDILAGLGSISTQAANNVAITGGAIDGVAIGANTAGSLRSLSLVCTIGSCYVPTGAGFYVNSIKVVTDQQGAIANADTASVVSKVNLILAALRTHGLIATA